MIKTAPIKILEIKPGDKNSLGEDWLLADFGIDENDTHYYLTTDCVHASDLSYIEELYHLTPKELATILYTVLSDSDLTNKVLAIASHIKSKKPKPEDKATLYAIQDLRKSGFASLLSKK